jgi:protein involved in polysaccharide export with SLBB domain
LYCLNFLGGCASVTNPVAGGVPVERLPAELLGQSRQVKAPIPHAFLSHIAPGEYRLGPGDVLGVWIEGVLGDRRRPIPVQISSKDEDPLPPAAGFPIRVEDDGSLLLPQLPPLWVAGQSVEEARETIRDAYVQAGILRGGREQILLWLLYRRRNAVIVLREELTGRTTGPEGFVSTSKQGTGHQVYLPADQSDVLHALELTGGLPGLDACDEVVVFRAVNSFRARSVQQQTAEPESPQVLRIPLRWPAENPLPFGPEDVLLFSGDVVYVKARSHDVYFTAGLLPPGEYDLPRDVDLDVVEAISRVQGPLLNGATGVSRLEGTVLQPGIGNPSPALLSVLRKTPDGGQMTIEVDLDQALCDPKERILVQPGDILVLQEKPNDALARYLSRSVVNFNLLWEGIHSRYVEGVVDVSAPDRLANRIGAVVFPRRSPGALPPINQLNQNRVHPAPFNSGQLSPPTP